MPTCLHRFLPICLFAFALAGCFTDDPVNAGTPVPVSAATQPSGSTYLSARPCFESGCHADLKTNDGPYVHEPYRDDKCLDCHEIFHEPETQLLYTQSDIDLCYGCHPLDGLGNTHPVGEGVIDPNTGQMMTCTSTCHLGHTAPYPFLLSLSPDGALCVSCHQEYIRP